MDQAEYSTILMPALVRRGPLRMAISTSGTAPALAKTLRQNLESVFDEEFDQFLDWLGALREELKENGSQRSSATGTVARSGQRVCPDRDPAVSQFLEII